MLPEERDAAYIWDMLEAARRACDYIGGLELEAYLGDDMIQAAVERVLGIVGEAARHVSASFRDAHPEIPWAQIIGQRNVLAHEYGSIDQARIWRLVVERVPELITQLEDAMPEPPVPA
ncbi:MAG: HepT-like ribonuclease domain-containing protein [Thermoleophilia bacterium]